MESVIKCTLFSEEWPPLTGKDQGGSPISDRVLISRIDKTTIIGFRQDENGDRLLLDDNYDLIHSYHSWAPLPEMP